LSRKKDAFSRVDGRGLKCRLVELFRSTFQSSNPIGQYNLLYIYTQLYAHMCHCPNNTLN